MTDILMPRLSDTMEEGVISAWHKQPGDEVKAGEVIADIETDKAIMEYEAYEDGVLQQIIVKEGDSAAIGAPIAVLGGDGAAAAPAAAPAADGAPASDGTAGAYGTAGAAAQAGAGASASGATASPPAEPATAQSPAAGPPSGPAAGSDGRRQPSSPLARRVAADLGVDLSQVQGTGPGGRIRRADVEAAAKTRPASEPVAAEPAGATPATAGPSAAAGSAAAVQDDGERVKLGMLAKTAAKRMTESKQNAPHFYLNRLVEVDALLEFRATLNGSFQEQGIKISVNDLIVRAVARALVAHPEINVSYDGDYLIKHNKINVGVAVAIDGGLLVPVVRDADRKTVSEISAETRDLATRARDRKLTPQEMSGGTFSVSNLGMFGIDSFSAVINPPEAAILAVGTARDEVVLRDGEVGTRKVMTLTLSVDHRATDGATGAKFLATLADLLENPLRILA